MEGSKNAMYTQAGRSRGWTQGMQETMPHKEVMPTHMVETVPVVPAPAIKSVHVIPEPPVVVLPVLPVIEAPSADLPVKPVAELSGVMMSATAKVEMESVTMSMPKPMPPVEAEQPYMGCEMPVMAYIPMQKWCDLYDPEQGMSRGTIFTKLDLPWVGEGACRYE